MANLKTIQSSFASGEISPGMAGRVDMDKYITGAKRLRNMFVHAHGGVSNRPGTYFAGYAAGAGRLIPFQFSVVQTYVLEFTDYKIRIIKDGGLVT